MDAQQAFDKHTSYEPEDDNHGRFYNAFIRGWNKGDQMKLPEPPHSIFYEEIEDDLIEEMFLRGYEKYQEYKY